ncbi:MAG: DUF4179 domain-containing protein [Ruminococcus sp.]|nr:DUF4179 domain-containing protein [Ruminococcus sp.]
MKEKEIIKSLQQDIVIPDIVQKKADLALKKINNESKMIVLRSRKRKWKTMWIAATAAVLALGTTVCAAVYMYQSKGLKAELQMTPEDKVLLEKSDYMASIVDETDTHESITAEGITVTPLQMIVDERFAWLSFKVEGYDLEEGEEPWFDTVNIVVDEDEEAVISYFSSFYDGLMLDENRNFIYEDGTPATDTQGNLVMKYVDEEGCMEYIIQINGTHYERGLVGASLHVTFAGLGTVDKAEFTPDIDAAWEFDMELKGSDEVRKAALSAPLGDSGATVTYAEISPISIYVNYDFLLQREEIEAEKDGETITTTTFVEAPDIEGVRLKDGTLVTGITDGGSVGYADSSETLYTASYAFSQVIDTKEIDALLFVKTMPEVEEDGRYGAWREENFYIVPIE